MHWKLRKQKKKLLNNKVLIVEGSAGIGKSHLFANETFEILNDNECVLLIIAGECLDDSNILEQVKNNLRISFQFEDLIDILDVIGASREKIIPILIDAVNESWKPQLWKQFFRYFITKFVIKNMFVWQYHLEMNTKKQYYQKTFLR